MTGGAEQSSGLPPSESSPRRTRRAWAAYVLIALGVAVATVGLHYLESRDLFGVFRVLRAIELKTLDLRFQLRGPRDPGRDIVIVAIDEKSIEEYGRYPWGRGVVAKLIDRLSSYGAKAVAFDIFYSEPQNQSLLNGLGRLLREIERAPTQNAESHRAEKLWIEDELRREDQDALMAAALLRAVNRGTTVCLAIRFVGAMEKRYTGFAGKKMTPAGRELLFESAYPVVFPRGEERKTFLDNYRPRRGFGVVPVIDRFAENVCYQGFADYTTDYSGIVHEECMAIEYADGFYPPLGVQAYRAYRDIRLDQVRLDLGEHVVLGDAVVPIDEQNRMLINYCGPSGSFPRFSFSDVAEGRASANSFRGKAVFVGATAKGLGDFIATPYSSQTPGVEKHATVLENILHRKFLRGQWATLHWDLLNVVVLCAVLGSVLAMVPPLHGTIVCALTWIGYCAWAFYAFVEQGVWRNVTLPTISVFGCFGSIMLYRSIFEERQKRLVKSIFEHYLHPTVVSQILRDPEKMRLGGERQKMSIYFSDVEGFTGIAERLSPSELIAVLNRYFSEMTDIVLRRNGLLDKYVGDEIVAAFGPPLGLADHALHACMAALECQERLRALRKECPGRGEPELFVRIGINSGEATVGNIGSAKRFNYTIIGDAVNLASRLEGANKEYGTYIMISQTTRDLVGDRIAFRELDLIRVSGRVEPVRVFEPVAPAGQLSPPQQALIDFYHRGLELYRKRKWTEASAQFAEALSVCPTDGPARALLNRCKLFKSSPTWTEWDAVFDVSKK